MSFFLSHFSFYKQTKMQSTEQNPFKFLPFDIYYRSMNESFSFAHICQYQASGSLSNFVLNYCLVIILCCLEFVMSDVRSRHY